MVSGVHSSLHRNCHHQIVFARFILKFVTTTEREIWHYEKVNADLCRRSISQLSWNNRFSNIRVTQKVHLFNQTIKSILSNFILHETIVCDDRDPLWINSKIKV